MESPLQLKIVELVLSKLSGNGHDSIGAIISDLLTSDISLSKAIELSHPGSLALLDFVWMRSLRDMEHSRWTVAKLLQSEKDYYKWEFSLALVRAIRRADLKMVQWILTHFSNCPVEKEVVEEAAKGGHLWVLQLLETDNSHDGIEWGTTCMNNAAKSGLWDLVHWLHQRIGTPISEPRFHGKIADYAFYQCNVEKLKWVIANGFELSNYLCVDKCDFSKREKCWEVVRYVLSGGHSNVGVLINRAAEEAAKLGDIEFTKWLIDFSTSGKEDIADDLEKSFAGSLEAAGRYGHVAVLECLLTHMTAHIISHEPSEAMFQAAKYGKIEVVKWLMNRYAGDSTIDLFKGLSFRRYATRTMSPNTVMDVAASHGHLEILQFLHQVDASQRNKRKHEDRDTYPTRDNCRRCTARAMDLAAANGHLEVVKWLHENRNEGCTTFAMSSAASNGHLEVVQWLHTNRSEGCTHNVIDRVATSYYRVSSCCGNRLRPREYYEPNLLVKNQLPIVQWLHEHDFRSCTTSAMDGAAANDNLELVRWLHDHTQAGCTTNAMDVAAGRGRLEMIKWLHENTAAENTTAAMDYAAGGGHLDVLKWLHSNRSTNCTGRGLDLAVNCDAESVGWISVYGSTECTSKIGCFHLKVIQWIVDHGEHLNIKSAMERAIVCEQPEIVFFLDGHRADREESVNKMRQRLRRKTLVSWT